MNILLVEDNENIQKINKRLLERKGKFNVRLAMTLNEARAEINRIKPDLLVLDIMLPDGTGLDFLRELRVGNGEWRVPESCSDFERARQSRRHNKGAGNRSG